MADRVIIVGVARGRSRVPTSEIKQMIGRAGRKQNEDSCRATIVIREEYLEDFEAEMEDKAGLKVSSQIVNSDDLAFHILPDIINGRVKNKSDAAVWFKQTLASFQSCDFKFDEALALLQEVGAIDVKNGEVRATQTGAISSRMYLNPADVWAWKRNFDNLFEEGLEENDNALAWALGSVPEMRFAGDFGRHRDVIGLSNNGIPRSLPLMEGTSTTIALWWNVLGGPSVGKMKNAATVLRRDSGRICRALLMLDEEVSHWGRYDFFMELITRCQKRIPFKLVELCRINGITKSMALHLHDMGAKTIEDIPEIMKNTDEFEIGDKFYKILMGISNELSK